MAQIQGDKKFFQRTYPATARVLRAYRWRQLFTQRRNVVLMICLPLAPIITACYVWWCGVGLKWFYSASIVVVYLQIFGISIFFSAVVSAVGVHVEQKAEEWIFHAEHAISRFASEWRSSDMIWRDDGMYGFRTARDVFEAFNLPTDSCWPRPRLLLEGEVLGLKIPEIEAMNAEIREKMFAEIWF